MTPRSLLLLLGFMLGVLGSLLMAWCMSKVYGWFVAPDLGPGPSLAGWYGLAVVVHLIIMGPLSNVQRQKEESESAYAPLGTLIGISLASVIITASSYLTGLVCGWV